MTYFYLSFKLFAKYAVPKLPFPKGLGSSSKKEFHFTFNSDPALIKHNYSSNFLF